MPMTKEEEEEKLVDLTVRHMTGRKELQARIKRRCWAATLANHAFTLRADVAHARHQLRVCKGKDLPEELEDARRRNHHFVVTMRTRRRYAAKVMRMEFRKVPLPPSNCLFTLLRVQSEWEAENFVALVAECCGTLLACAICFVWCLVIAECFESIWKE